MNRSIFESRIGPITTSKVVAKRVTSLPLALHRRPPRTTRTRWLCEELRRAVVDGRLPPGTRLPATRDLAQQYGVSRGTAVDAFEQLRSEGYLVARVGAGTWVNQLLPFAPLEPPGARVPSKKLPAPVRGVPYNQPPRPFRAYEPGLTEFPVDAWARVAGRRLRTVSPSLLAGGDVRGYLPLREAIAAYLGSSRGVHCTPDSVVIVSGAQQGLDLVARVLVTPGDAVWIEDPGYFGAVAAFRQAGARIVPVPVDGSGLAPALGLRACRYAKAAYLTPAHQFPLGMTMPLERRLALLTWAREAGAYLIEDDYDSEYRFSGQPVPALQGLDKSGSVVFLGSFSKVLFPSLRLGYLVLPEKLLDPLLVLRFGVDLHPPGLTQAILCDFISGGHLARHIRRMRGLYAERLATLQDVAPRYMDGLLAISPIQAGLATVGFLRSGITSSQAEAAATSHGIEALGLDRFALRRSAAQGLLLGFAAFDERQIRRGIVTLASALEKCAR